MHRCLRPTLVLLLVLVTGCGSDDERIAAAEAVAADLARGLATQDLSGVAMAGGGDERYSAVVSGMGDRSPQVEVQGVAVEGDAATVTLAWQWPTPATPWTHETTAELTWADDLWTVQWAPDVVQSTLTEGEALVLSVEHAQRGDILGAADVPLVTERAVVRFGIDKTRVPAGQAGESARRLASLVGIAPRAFAQRVTTAGSQALVPAVVLRKSDVSDIRTSELDAIPGAVGLPAKLPLAPTRDFGAAVLGRVGPATAQIVEESEGEVRPGDQVGLSGLQARYEQQLAGVPGVSVQAVQGTAKRELFSSAPIAGEALSTTLDPRLQRNTEARLVEVGPASAVVVIQPSTGAVLAAANGPGSDGYSTATVGQYAPGSTMKVVTALALMRAGVDPSDLIPCTESVVVDGKAFTNYDDYPPDRLGQITLISAVANSCNTALISQHALLGDDDLTRAAAALGLGVDHDLGFPAYFGQVPVASSKTNKAAALIGQGEVLASPLAMATVAASVAEGRAVLPRLLTGQAVEQRVPDQPLTKKEAQALRTMMRAVVTDGSGTSLSDVPGEPIGAKTGTAEFGTGVPLPTHTWMIAFQGDLAVAAFVEVGQSGSQTAGPILEGVLSGVR